MTPAEWKRAFLARVMASADQSLAIFAESFSRQGAQAFTPVVCPVVIDAATSARLEAQVRAWHAGMHEVLRQWASAPAAEAIALPAGLEGRVRGDALNGTALGSTRYDFVVDALGAATLIECQAGDPSGMGMEETSACAFASLDDFGAGLSRTSIAASFSRFIATPGLVVFVIHHGSFVEWDVRRLVEVCQTEGVDAVMAEADALRFADGRLWLGERVVSKVVRDSLEDLLAPERVEASRALMEAWAAGAVEVVNPIGSIAADHKVLLGRLRSNEVLQRLPAEIVQRLSDSVPETVELGLVEQVPARERWVLKPSDGFGGFDVTVGPAVSDDEWASAVSAARQSGRTFLLQTAVAAEREPFPVVVDGRLALRELYVVRSGWMHGDRFGGLYARAREDAVVNVHQGGGLVPVYTLAS